MPNVPPPSDAWLERSRLDGMMLNGFTYGIFFLLSIQAGIALSKGGNSPRSKLKKWHARILMGYVVVTFLLGTIGFGANARYTEDIWINFRGDWDPAFLITNEFIYWYNRMAIDSNFIMVWLMNLLLLYRCFVIWAWEKWVMALMTAVYLAIVALSIAVMISAENSAIFFNLNTHLSFLVLSCTFNLLFTTLVATRLLMVHNRIKKLMGVEHATTYTSVAATLVESASLYFVFDVIFVVTFAIHSNVENLVLLENCLIQGVAQLLIIVRVAKGREYDATIATQVRSTKLSFRQRARTAASNQDENIAVSLPMSSQGTRTKNETLSYTGEDGLKEVVDVSV